MNYNLKKSGRIAGLIADTINNSNNLKNEYQ